MKSDKMKAISLFSGCGGDSQGLKQAGFEILGFVEFWNKAVQTHKMNFPNSMFIGEKVKGDITKISDKEFSRFKGKVDVLFAGFPCQGFSRAGKKDPRDPRNKLFWEFVRAAKLIKPKWIVGENVAGLVNRRTDDGKSLVSDVIKSAFKKAGYSMAEPEVLKAEKYGVPQKRRRVFFVGNRKGMKFEFPEPSSKINNLPNLRNIIEKTNIYGAKYNPKKVHGLDENEIIYYDSEEKPKKKPHPYLLRKLKEEKVSFGKRISPYHIEVVDPDSQSKTIHCGYSFQPRLFVGISNKLGFFIREFTNKELALIQGFPESYKFAGSRKDIIKQIGNAVPPGFVEAIAKKIVEIDSSLRDEKYKRKNKKGWKRKNEENN